VKQALLGEVPGVELGLGGVELGVAIPGRFYDDAS